ncbi:DUF4998 domain-containing protein [Mucilaginibacter sp. cycad4]|uniref:DUF5000 domain-containing lipoprotein n=1 Tax=Mucilaginibacter sp. cycad4 TaxID=3342096 RepID=UPI002AABD49C|nr:DUF5000 domain-containing lipoprotein [Mucilaginibacter gossypii]WPU97777.1 DUF4998 domain-containing protein [Mucilaginibacter gossypii]
MKIRYSIAAFFLAGIAIFACKKYDKDYKAFLDNHEVTYPGLASKVTFHPGNLRAVLVWHPSPDPSIKNYKITWNNATDSVIVDATSHSPADSISVSIPNLKEYVYSFRLVARDNAGNSSVGQDINNVRVYGAAYQSALLNRSYNTANPFQVNDNGSVRLFFIKADTGNVSTTIKYTNTAGAEATKELSVDSSGITLTDLKLGTAIQYRSSYKPTADAVDVFNTTSFDDFPKIYGIAECDKSLFKPYNLPTDIPSAYGWETYYLWDKSTNEPGFHTPGTSMPQWFTFDMGQQASLAKMKIWQRMSALYNVGNPKRFEIYGSNSPSADGSYGSWTKLASFTSVKPSGLPAGQNTQADADFAAAGEPFNFPADLPAYRYIRFKVLETWGGTNYFHLIELTMYKVDK